MNPLRNRGLWCFAVTTVALVAAYNMTPSHHRVTKFWHSGVLTTGIVVVVILLVMGVLILIDKEAEKVKYLVLVLLALGSMGVGILVGATVIVKSRYSIDLSWWSTRGFAAWLFLFAGMIACGAICYVPKKPAKK